MAKAFRTAAVVFTSCLALCSAYAADDSLAIWAEGKELVAPACERYVKKFAGVGAQPRWQKKTLARAAQRIVDKQGNSSEPAELQAMALDWASDHEGALRSRDRGAMLEGCFWLLLFREKDVPPPAAMRDRITRQNFQQLAAELDDMVKAGG
jgi:hypothetical protein